MFNENVEITENILKKKIQEFLATKKYAEFLPVGFSFELISHKHTPSILTWRNDPQNLANFIQQDKISEKDQTHFIDHYWSKKRLDFVLLKEEKIPIGVFSLTKLDSSEVEIGKLMGNKDFRGLGLSKSASCVLMDFAKNYLSLPHIFSTTRKDNITNIELNKKIGFKIVNEKRIENTDYYLMEKKL